MGKSRGRREHSPKSRKYSEILDPESRESTRQRVREKVIERGEIKREKGNKGEEREREKGGKRGERDARERG